MKIIHLAIGNSNWTPTKDEEAAIKQEFAEALAQAEETAQTQIVTTRDGVVATLLDVSPVVDLEEDDLDVNDEDEEEDEDGVDFDDEDEDPDSSEPGFPRTR